MKLNSRLLHWILCSQLVLVANAARVSAAETAKHGLNISSLPAEVQKDLVKLFPQITSKQVSLETADDIIRYLQMRPEFDLVQIENAGGNQLKITTARSTRISQIKFEGLRALGESEAKQLFGINQNDVLNQDLLQVGGQKLVQQYNQLGYRNASLDVEIPPDGKGDVQLIVKVNEGLQTLIGGFTFSSPNNELNKALENRLIREKGYAVTDAQLAEVLTKIREYLNTRFYVRTEIKGPEITFNTDESRAQLSFRLEKVDSYQIDYQGNREISSSSLNQSLNIGNFYSANPNIGSELTAKIKQLYLSRGFARVEVQSEDSEGRKPFTRKITFNIEEGPKVKINKYDFSGTLSRPPEYYTKLLKKLASDLVQNDYYNKIELDQAFEALRIELQNQGFLFAKINSTRIQYT